MPLSGKHSKEIDFSARSAKSCGARSSECCSWPSSIGWLCSVIRTNCLPTVTESMFCDGLATQVRSGHCVILVKGTGESIRIYPCGSGSCLFRHKCYTSSGRLAARQSHSHVTSGLESWYKKLNNNHQINEESSVSVIRLQIQWLFGSTQSLSQNRNI